MDLNLLFTLLAVPEIHPTKFKQPRLKSQPEGRFYIEDPLVLGISHFQCGPISSYPQKLVNRFSYRTFSKSLLKLVTYNTLYLLMNTNSLRKGVLLSHPATVLHFHPQTDKKISMIESSNRNSTFNCFH